MCVLDEKEREYRFGDSGPKYLMRGPRSNFAVVKFNKATFYKSIMENAGLITLGHLKMVEEITGNKPEEIFFAGGSAYSELWSQTIADILGIRVITPKEKEATALGAAFLAGLATGYWKNLDELKNLNTAGKLFIPTMEKEEREKLYKGWKRAVRATQIFADGRY